MSDATNRSSETITTDTSHVVRVDDGSASIDGLATLLERRNENVDVSAASDSDEVIELVAADAVDCVVADAEVVGVEFVADLRERNADLPCVVITSDPTADRTDELLAAGATDVVQRRDDDRYDVAASRIEHFAEGYRAQRRVTSLESELREKARLLEQIFEQIPAALYVKDTEARHVRMSDYDVEPDTVDGKTDPEIYGDTEFSRQTYEDDLHVIETGEPVVNKEEYNPGNGEWTLTSKVPWYGDDGEIQGLIGVSMLITEKKEYERELKRTNERLEKFAGIVSHDLRSPLNVATGRLEILREEVDDEHVAEIADSLDRIGALIEDLLTLARQGQTIDEVRTVDVGDLGREAWSSVETGPATLALESDVTIEADDTRLLQLLENLFRNAVEHGGADVTVRVGALDDGFYVEDDGTGIGAEHREAVLDEGFTTAEDGTGFGLSIVEEIASAHAWKMEVTESSDGGARFEFTADTQQA